jgi:hypothetical protein
LCILFRKPGLSELLSNLTKEPSIGLGFDSVVFVSLPVYTIELHLNTWEEAFCSTDFIPIWICGLSQEEYREVLMNTIGTAIVIKFPLLFETCRECKGRLAFKKLQGKYNL